MTASALPPFGTSFVAREATCADVEHRLGRDGALVTLTGPGGVGKTRLAVEAARRLEQRGLVCAFCDLSGARGRSDLVRVVSAAVGVAGAGGTLDAEVVQVGRALTNRAALLLVLDNFEQLREAAGVIDTWRALAPRARLLVTSRIALDCGSEQIVSIEPLDRDAAVRLFADRARARSGAAVWTGDSERAAQELVEQLDRLPLAIELAASWAEVLGPAQLRDALVRRLPVLSRADRPGSRDRHASMGAAVAWTWELLQESEREALARASVFAGGLTVDAAAFVWEVGEASALVLARSLRAHSLLRAVPTAGGERVRLQSYESVMEHARAELERSGFAPRAHDRHAEWFLARARQWAEAARGPAMVDALDRFDEERDNVVAAYRHLVEHDATGAAHTALALDALLHVRGPFVQHIELLSDAVERVGPRVAPVIDARLRLACGSALRRAGRLEDARAEIRRGLTLSKRAPNDRAAREIRAELLLARAKIDHIAGHLARAAGDARRGLAIARRIRAPRTVAAATGDLAAIEGDVRLARRWLDLVRNERDPLGEAYAQWTIGRILRDAGRPLEAAASLERALSLARALSERRLLPLALGSLAIARHVADETETALALYLETASLHGANGNALMQSFALTNLASLEHELERYADARTHLHEALHLTRAAGSARGEALVGGHLAALAASCGQLAEANALLADAREKLERNAKDDGDARSCLDALALIVAERAEGDGDRAAGASGTSAGARRRERARGRARGRERAAPETLVARRLAHVVGERPARASGVPTLLAPESVVVGPDARWVRVGAGIVDLARRRALQRIVVRLADQRRVAPADAVAHDDLVRSAWPGERLSRASANNRLRNAIATLRRLGLKDLLLTRTDGYLLDPRRPVVRERDRRT